MKNINSQNKENNNKLKHKSLLIILVLTLIFVGIFATYAFFKTPGENNQDMTANLKAGELALVFSDGDNGINESLEFGSTVTKKFTIENTGTLNASLSLDWDELINTYTDGSLTYKLSFSETEDGEKQELLSSTNVPTSSTPLNQSLISELTVPAKSTYYYFLDITLNNTDFDQTADINAFFTTKFNVGQAAKYRYYLLSIDPNGGTWNDFTSTQEYHLLASDTMNIPAPTRVGYSFDGWNNSSTSSTIENETFTMGTSNTNLTANWSVSKYTVTIDINGELTEQEVEYGGTIELPESPTKEGHTFSGWDITGGTLSGNTLTITDPENITVKATWTPNNYKYIVYHKKQNITGDGYTLIDADTDEGEAEYAQEVTPGTKNYQGFKVPPVQSLTIKAEETYPPLLNKVEYNYDRNKYNLTLELDGGTTTTTGGEMYYESTKTLIPPTKTGYNFTNWTASSGRVNDNIFTMGSSDATLTANYTPKTFTVTYNANGGTPSTQSKTVTYNSKYIMPDTTPTRSGYEFLGWFTASSGGTQISSNIDVKLNGNQTLYAQWKQSLITIAYGLKTNTASITDYNSGNKGEMYTFTHPEAEQTTGWTESERTDYRYIGNTPNNYIQFNDETWRIIGVFTVEGENGEKEQRIKIIRDQSIGGFTWDKKSDGTYSNEWSTSSLATMLNGDYVNKEGSFTYTWYNSSGTVQTSRVQGLNSTAKSQISPTKWYLGGISTYQNLGGSDYYNFERGSKTCVTDSSYCSGQTRSTNTMANVGLMYPSDHIYTYANGVDNTCFQDGYNCDTGTPASGWLFNSAYQWTITPYSSNSNHAFGVSYTGFVFSTGVDNPSFVSRPVVYLRSDIEITSGSGTSSDPYRLKS